MDDIHLFGIASCVIFISIIIDQKKRRKVVFQAINNPNDNDWFIFVAAAWFILACLYIGLFIKYGNENCTQDTLLRIISYMVLGSIYLLRGVQKDLICEDGICTKKGNYKWDRIKDYEWGVREYIGIKSQNFEYHYLTFTIHSRQSYKWFIGSVNKKIYISIKVSDKKKVEEFLKQVVLRKV